MRPLCWADWHDAYAQPSLPTRFKNISASCVTSEKKKQQPPRTSHNYLQPVEGMSANRLQVLIIFALSWTMLAMLWNFHLQTYDNVYVSRWHREHIILNSLALQHPHYCKLWPFGRVGPPLKQTLWNTEHLTIDEFLKPCPPKLIDIPNSPYEGLPRHWGRCWLHTHVYMCIYIYICKDMCKCIMDCI